MGGGPEVEAPATTSSGEDEEEASGGTESTWPTMCSDWFWAVLVPSGSVWSDGTLDEGGSGADSDMPSVVCGGGLDRAASAVRGVVLSTGDCAR